jgi:hypothetical protein
LDSTALHTLTHAFLVGPIYQAASLFASILRVEERQQVIPKHWYLSARLHRITSQKAAVSIFTVLRTSDLSNLFCKHSVSTRASGINGSDAEMLQKFTCVVYNAVNYSKLNVPCPLEHPKNE